MRPRSLLLAVVLGTSSVLPASPASACITWYVPVVGSICKPCPGVQAVWADLDETALGALPDTIPCPRP